MLKKLDKFWKSLDGNMTVSKRELFLVVTACTLAGILTGILLSPKKAVAIGSNNGNNKTGTAASAGEGDGEDTEE